MTSRRRAPRTRTYRASGVDRSAVTEALSALLRASRGTAPADHGVPIPLPGHFAGLIRIGPTTIAATTDTVGTKVLLADRLGRWEEVGEDLVAINVNDLAAVGARAAGVVDTVVCARPDPPRFAAIGRGIGRGLRAARCSLLGGETAVVPDLVHGIDLGATAIGFFPDGRVPVTGRRIRPGDRLVGIPSSGFHANGFTLLRRVLDEGRIHLRRPRPGQRAPLGVELLRPTRTYTEPVDAVADVPGVHGLAHLSGGGVRNLVRLAPQVEFRLDRWPRVPDLFRWLQDRGGVSTREMFQTFNMGVGFVLVVAPRAVPAVRARLARTGAADAVEIGTVAPGRGIALPELGLRFDGYS